MSARPFQPVETKTLAYTSATLSTSINGDQPTIRLSNPGSSEVFVKWGIGAQTALSDGTQLSILPGTVEVFWKGNADTIAAIGGTGNLRISTGHDM
jgi:hypothetical protein